MVLDNPFVVGKDQYITDNPCRYLLHLHCQAEQMRFPVFRLHSSTHDKAQQGRIQQAAK